MAAAVLAKIKICSWSISVALYLSDPASMYSSIGADLGSTVTCHAYVCGRRRPGRWPTCRRRLGEPGWPQLTLADRAPGTNRRRCRGAARIGLEPLKVLFDSMKGPTTAGHVSSVVIRRAPSVVR